jgi:hypothetical protein
MFKNRMQLVVTSVLVPLVFLMGSCSSPGSEETLSTNRPTETVTVQPETKNEVTEGDLTQTVEYTISGGCLDSYETVGYYGMFEEFGDDCYLVVEVFPPEPSRLAELQYFDTTWVTESFARTDSTGIAYLEVDPFCEDGLWCDGLWEYRVFLGAESGLPADRSITFELDFLPFY